MPGLLESTNGLCSTEDAMPAADQARIWSELDTLRKTMEDVKSDHHRSEIGTRELIARSQHALFEKLELKISESTRELRHVSADNANAINLRMQANEARNAQEMQSIKDRLDMVEDTLKEAKAVERWKQGKFAAAWSFMGIVIGVLIKWVMEHIGGNR